MTANSMVFERLRVAWFSKSK